MLWQLNILIFLTNLVTISLYLKTTSLQLEYVEIYALVDLLKVALGTDVPSLNHFQIEFFDGTIG